ncbi:MAG: hypothetical protein ACJA0M_001286 [Chitinophagales bacterium]|jgi:hypothetical protein
MNKPIESCWCNNIELSKSDNLTNTITNIDIDIDIDIDGTACICKKCAAKFNPETKEL